MRLLITGAWRASDGELAAITALGHEVIWMQQESGQLPCPPEQVDGVICNSLFQHHRIEQFKRLSYVQLVSAGLDRIPLTYVVAHHIVLRNARDVYSVPMAEHAVCGVLMLYRQMHFFVKNQRAHKWEKNRSCLELAGKTVCIVGCGSVGSACARRFSALGCQVVGVDRYTQQGPDYCAMLELAKLDEVLSWADIVLLALPLTENTHRFMDSRRLALLKPSAVLVSLSRGAVIDQRALEKRLPTLGGAVLDVFESEPLPPDSPLWDMENVILTPHNSYVGENNSKRMAEVIFRNLKHVNGAEHG